MRGLCVVKIPQRSALFKGAQNKKRAIQVCAVYPQSPSASPTEYLEYFTCCAGVKDAALCRVAEDARQHDAPRTFCRCRLLKISRCCEE